MSLAPRSTTIPAPYVLTSSEEWDGDDGSWSTFIISVGTPGQDFRVLVSTASGETWVPVPEGCTVYDPSNCASLRGAQAFNAASSPGFQVNQSSTWDSIGIYNLGVDAVLNYTGNGQYGYDTVRLGPASDTSAPSVDKQVVAGIATKAFYMGMIGLDTQPSSFSSDTSPSSALITSLYQQGKIPSLSYGYTAGAKYREKSVVGNLVLGGYDQSRFTPSNLSFTFGSDSERPLLVGIQSIIASDSLLGVASMTDSSSGHYSNIDSTVSELWLPQSICDQFEAAFGLTYSATYDRYLVNDSMHSQLLSMNPTFTFKLGNDYTVDDNSTNIELPYAAFDLTGTYPIFPNDTYYFPIRRAANDSQYTLGRTFLQEAYLVVDHERGNFTLGQAVFSDPMPDSNYVTILPKNATSTTGSSNSSSPLSTGAIVGIAVGAAAAIILSVLGFILWRRKKRRAEEKRVAELADTERQKQEDPNAQQAAYGAGTNKPTELAGESISELPSPGQDPKWNKEQYAREQRQYLLGAAPQELESPHTPGMLTHMSGMSGLPSPASPPVMYELPGEYYVPVSQNASSAGSRRPSQ